MPSLADRLKSLGVKVGAHNLPPPRPHVKHPIEDLIAGKFLSTSGGVTFLAENFYPLDYRHGQTGLQINTSLHIVAEWAGDNAIAGFPAQSLAFLDTETSGLAGGTGTFAFLVGVGRITQDGFQLAQFFMRDPGEEPALLLALEEWLAPCRALVTFNGKSFDAPLLNTRYTLHGWSTPLGNLAHIDLLHLARRLWRDRLPSRTLSNLEVQILGARRSLEEVPGWMIPQIYFDYLHDGDAHPLKSVFYHNAMDVLSMAALLNHIAKLLNGPSENSDILGVDLAAIARLYEELGHLDLAEQAYKASLETNLPQDIYTNTVQRLSYLYKRQGNYSSAIKLWEISARNEQVYAFIELAKYYEHHAQEIQWALSWTRQALELIKRPDYPPLERNLWLGDLEHRLERLERKSHENKV